MLLFSSISKLGGARIDRYLLLEAYVPHGVVFFLVRGLANEILLTVIMDLAVII